MMNQIDANQLLNTMKALASEARQLPIEYNVANLTQNKESDFSNLFHSAIGSVNDLQQNAGNLVKRFEANDSSVEITEVMIALQKANLSFQAMSQVRNQVVNAYQEIMSMPI
jgi:flagellar hook-basal body complex protein FliE